MSSFLTISGLSEGIYKEKGSKFLGYAFPVKSEEEVKNILAELKKDHPKARHICYAYRLGADKSIFKASDAGEPHNSAGQPILGQIRSFDLTDVLVAVVRYFGGTKLGIPGLTAAYKDAAHDALKNGVIIEDTERTTLDFETDYAHLTELMNFVKQNNVRILEQDLTSGCRLKISVPVENLPALKAGLQKLQMTKVL
jgi:uncharacterized YigZ family protein